MVVDQHILGAYAKLPETNFGEALILHMLYLLGRPAVPMFIAITGFTLFYTSQNHFNIKDFYIKRLKTIVVPYLFWSLASIIIFKEYDKLKNLLPILVTGTASYHLWYMGMSIRLYLIFPIIFAMAAWIKRKSSTAKILIFIAFCVFYRVIFVDKEYLVNHISMFFFGSNSLLERRFIEYDPIFWSIYFVCGAIVFFKYDTFKRIVTKYAKVIVAAYIPIALYMYYAQVCSILPQYFPRITAEPVLYTFFMLLTSIIIYIICLRLSSSTSRFGGYTTKLGVLSFGAYLVHVIVLQRIAPIIWGILPINSHLILGILIFIATSAISFGICYLISWLPLSRYIIGVRQNSK